MKKNYLFFKYSSGKQSGEQVVEHSIEKDPPIKSISEDDLLRIQKNKLQVLERNVKKAFNLKC